MLTRATGLLRALPICLPLTRPATAAMPPILPSQVTPPSVQMPEARPPPQLALPSVTTQAAPEGADTFLLSVGEVQISNGRPELAAQAEAIRARLTGQTIPLAALYTAASELERAYVTNGFPLTRVTVPPQRLTPGGPVRLMVVRGYIERVDLAGVPKNVRGYVWSVLAKLVGKPDVTRSDIERAVLLAGDAKGLSLKSAIAPGAQVGGAKLIVEGEATLVTASVSVDNALPASLGGWESSVALALNSPFGFGEQISLLYGTSLDGQPSRGLRTALGVVGIGVSVPIGSDGATLDAEYTHSTTRPRTPPGAPDVVGQFNRATLRLTYPLIREPERTVSISAGLDNVDQGNEAPQFGILIDHDRYAALRFGLNWQSTISETRTLQVRWLLSQGIEGRGDPSATQVPVSRLGATASFTKVNWDIELNQSWIKQSGLRLLFRGQYSFRSPMFVSEQFGIDNQDGVSGFPDGTLNVDSGVTLRGEVGRTFGAKADATAMSLRPYLFAGIGKGWIYRATEAEFANPFAASVGVGLHVELEGGPLPGLGLSFEAARHYSDLPTSRAGNRFRLVIVKHF